MIAVLPFLFVGALTFVEQGVTDSIPSAYRRADLDGDGRIDLILSHVVYFQRNGGFSQEGRVPLPHFDGVSPLVGRGGLSCDVWKDTLFVRSGTKLHTFRWERGTWKSLHEQEATWPKQGYDLDRGPLPGLPEPKSE
jgi:hypothetical protein